MMLRVRELHEAAHEAEVHALALQGHSRLLSASADASIKVWLRVGLLPLYTLRSRGRTEALAHDGAVYALLIVPASGATFAGQGRGVQPGPDTPARRQGAQGWRGGGWRAQLFSASADRLVKAWDLQTMDQLATLCGHRSFVCALAAQPERGLLFSASCDKTCAVWHLGTYERLHALTGHRGGVYSLTVHGGHICSGSLDETIRVWPSLPSPV